MRLIDADKLVFKLNNSQIENSEEYKGLGEAKQIVDNMPTVCDIEQIRADIEQVKAIMNEEIIERDRKDLINFVNGINQCLLIIEQHISGKIRTISERR